jgi:hypothetical protein
MRQSLRPRARWRRVSFRAPPNARDRRRFRLALAQDARGNKISPQTYGYVATCCTTSRITRNRNHSAPTASRAISAREDRCNGHRWSLERGTSLEGKPTGVGSTARISVSNTSRLWSIGPFATAFERRARANRVRLSHAFVRVAQYHEGGWMSRSRKRKMDRAETLVHNYLGSRGYASVVYEPDPNDPPDFLIDERIALGHRSKVSSASTV